MAQFNGIIGNLFINFALDRGEFMSLRLLKYVFVLFIIIFINSISHPKVQAATLQPSTNKLILHSSLELLEDKDNSLTIEDVVSPTYSNQFSSHESTEVPNFGYAASVYWARFEITNQSMLDTWMLEISYPPLNEISIYIPNQDGEYEKHQYGNQYPFKFREIIHRDFVVPSDMELEESKLIYIRFETDGALQMPLTLWEPTTFIEKTQKEFIYLGLYYGIAASMILYNLFLFFSLRDKSYLYYVMVIFTSMFANLALNGLAFQYVWPDYPWWNMRSIVFFICLGSAFSLLFTRNFLDMNIYLPKFKRFFQFAILMNFLNAGLLFISYPIALNVMVVSAVVTIVTILSASFICLKKGIRQARFFLLAWVVYLIGFFVSILADGGILPLVVWTKYSAQIAGVFEMILLSLALGDRITIMRREKEIAEREVRESQKLAVANTQLRQMEKSSTALLTSIAHELGTPITLVQSYTQAVQEGLIEANNTRYINMIQKRLKLLDRLTKDLLELAKLQSNHINLDFQQVNFGDWVEKFMQTIELDTNQSRRIFHYPPLEEYKQMEGLYITIDKERMDQVFTNIIWNAIKHTSEIEGVITLTITIEMQEEVQEYAEDELEGRVIIAIQDNGEGIPEKDIPFVFNRFYQASNIQKDDNGMGLGLAITKEIIHAHKGEIWVESKFYHGTTFYISLPLLQNRIHIKERV